MTGLPTSAKMGLGAHANVGVIRRACESCPTSRSVRTQGAIGLCNNCPFTGIVAAGFAASGAAGGQGRPR